MSNWKLTNERLVAALKSADKIASLLALFRETEDGHVAMALGRQYASGGDMIAAVRWYREAERLYPLPKYQQQARKARAALEATGYVAPKSGLVADRIAAATVLHIVSCSKAKAWDRDPTAPRFLPAKKAYRGRHITDWLRDPRAATERWLILSAKYGFIEPDHPIGNYDVTFTLPATGPLSDASLQHQAEHQVRWADNVPLRSFGTVIVHGSSVYCDRVRAAFANLPTPVVCESSGGAPSRETDFANLLARTRPSAVGARDGDR